MLWHFEPLIAGSILGDVSSILLKARIHIKCLFYWMGRIDFGTRHVPCVSPTMLSALSMRKYVDRHNSPIRRAPHPSWVWQMPLDMTH